MALWFALGQAATLAQLFGVDLVSLICKVIKMAEKSQKNKKECKKLAYRVDTIAKVLPHMKNTRATRPLLSELKEALRTACELVESFQEDGAFRRFAAASQQADEFSNVQERIMFVLLVISVAASASTLPFPSPVSSCTTHKLRGAWQEIEIHGDGGEEFTGAELAWATDYYHRDRVISTSNTYMVYKGKLANSRTVAIKSISNNYSMELFHTEASILLRLKHKNIIRLFGTLTQLRMEAATGHCQTIGCMQVLKYTKNGSLADHLHGPLSRSSALRMSWKRFIEILLGVSRAVEYLHHDAAVIHGDISSSNILLSSSWTPHLSGFHFSRTMDDETNSNRCYYPEYNDDDTWRASATQEDDVYGVGILALEMMTGKEAPYFYPEGEDGYYSAFDDVAPMKLVDFALPLIAAGKLGKLLPVQEPAAELTPDERKALFLVARTAAHCVQFQGNDRPDISYVVRKLDKAHKLLCAHE
uniref:Protein kinase domain-containing protein n=1 Tax=Oryza punctata TaxID=4537 RepID=A0A0E0MHZ8_ORYPU